MIPNRSREELIEAMRRFDAELRSSKRFLGWEKKQNYKYAILYNDKLYPPKEIVRLATGMTGKQLRGGIGPTDSNAYISKREFDIIELQSDRNQPWVRDELILALDLYLSTRPSPPGKTSQSIARLSELLNKLGQMLGHRDYQNYRNPSGVYMKLMNFRALDPDYTREGKVGLARGGKGDATVWNEFAADPARCHKVAQAIQATIEADDTAQPLFQAAADDDYEAPEGRLLTVQHQRRERRPELVKKKKQKVLERTGHLLCEACQFDFSKTYGSRGEGFIECHHTKPLSEAGAEAKTRLDDLALLCSNCHRMIHVKSPWLTVEELRKLLG